MVAAISEASSSTPYNLSKTEPLQGIKSIRSTAVTGTCRVRAEAILKSILPSNVKKAYVLHTIEKKEMADELAMLIASADVWDEIEQVQMLDNLRSLNGRSSNPKIEPYWDAMAKVIELDGTGAHHRMHTDNEGIEKTTKISYIPSINLLEQLHNATLNHLIQVENKMKGEDFEIPSTE